MNNQEAVYKLNAFSCPSDQNTRYIKRSWLELKQILPFEFANIEKGMKVKFDKTYSYVLAHQNAKSPC